jgi:hypothetical protein
MEKLQPPTFNLSIASTLPFNSMLQDDAVSIKKGKARKIHKLLSALENF